MRAAWRWSEGFATSNDRRRCKRCGQVVLERNGGDRALEFLDRFGNEICGPDLLGVEVCRTLVAAANARRITAVEARTIINGWLGRIEKGDLALHSTDGVSMRAAADMAMTLGHPLKDCIYLALADRLGCTLATCDVRFRDRVADPARVRLLEELV